MLRDVSFHSKYLTGQPSIYYRFIIGHEKNPFSLDRPFPRKKRTPEHCFVQNRPTVKNLKIMVATRKSFYHLILSWPYSSWSNLSCRTALAQGGLQSTVSSATCLLGSCASLLHGVGPPFPSQIPPSLSPLAETQDPEGASAHGNPLMLWHCWREDGYCW